MGENLHRLCAMGSKNIFEGQIMTVKPFETNTLQNIAILPTSILFYCKQKLATPPFGQIVPSGVQLARGSTGWKTRSRGYSWKKYLSQWPPRSACPEAEFRPWAENLDPCPCKILFRHPFFWVKNMKHIQIEKDLLREGPNFLTTISFIDLMASRRADWIYCLQSLPSWQTTRPDWSVNLDMRLASTLSEKNVE